MATIATCTVNSYVLPVAGFTGYNASSGATITIALSVPASSWSIQCTDTDGYNPNSITTLINATMILDPIHNTATFVVPSGGPSAIQFTSVINTDPTSTFTFGVFVLDAFNRRLFFKNQTYESNATFGVVADLNKNQEISGGGGGGGGPPTGPAGGDLDGTYPNPQVNSLTGTDGTVEITTGAALDWTTGNVQFNIGGSFAAGYDGTTWSFGYPTTSFSVSPTSIVFNALAGSGSGYVAVNNTGTLSFASGIAPSGSAGGDLGGTYPNPTVTQARGLKSATTTVSISSATAPTTGQVLTATNSTTATWQSPASGGISALTGDVTASGSGSVAATVVKINGTSVPATPTSGQVLTATSGTSATWQAPSSAPTGTAGGDLGGTYPNPTVLSVADVTTGTLGVANGGTGRATLTAHSVLVGNGTTAVTQVGPATSGLPLVSHGPTNDPSFATLVVSGLTAGTSAQILLNSATPTPTWTTVGGDATISSTGSVTNVGLQGISVPTPTGTNTVLTYNSGAFSWGAGGGGGGITALTGDVTASGSGSVAATVVKINGTTVPAGGSLTTGNQLIVSGASAATWSALNLAGGSGYVTGNLPISNVAPGTSAQVLMSNATPSTTWTTISGDATFGATGALTLATVNSNVGTFGSATSIPVVTVNAKGLITAVTTATPTVTVISGITVSGTPSVNQVLTATSSSAANWQTPSGSGGITQLTGDVTAGPGSGSQVATVAQLQGSIVLSGTPASGNVLTATSSTAAHWAVPSSLVTVSSLKTANYTVLSTDYLVGIGTLTGSITITLPSSPTTGQTCVIKDVNGSTQQFVRDNAGTLTVVGYIVTVVPASGTIDGQNNYILQTPYQAITLTYTGSQWSVY